MNVVHCDGCGQDIEIQRLEDVERYHNQPCEECGEILINDMDMEIAESLIELKRLGLVSESVDELPEGSVRAHISTRGGELSIIEVNPDEENTE